MYIQISFEISTTWNLFISIVLLQFVLVLTSCYLLYFPLVYPLSDEVYPTYITVEAGIIHQDCGICIGIVASLYVASEYF